MNIGSNLNNFFEKNDRLDLIYNPKNYFYFQGFKCCTIEAFRNALNKSSTEFPKYDLINLIDNYSNVSKIVDNSIYKEPNLFVEIKTNINENYTKLKNFFEFPRSKFSKYERAIDSLY